MALFQNETTAGGVNYKSMSKEQLIMLLQSQKKDLDTLKSKLESNPGFESEKQRLEQQITSLSEENKALNHKLEALPELESEKKRLEQQVASLSEENGMLKRRLESFPELERERMRLEQQVASLSTENSTLIKEAAEREARFPATSAAITEPGSIAEMSFRINGVMEVAQKAADDYILEIRKMRDALKQEYSTHEAAAQQKADAIIRNAQAEADSITQKARDEANDIWSSLQTRFNNYISDKKQ